MNPNKRAVLNEASFLMARMLQNEGDYQDYTNEELMEDINDLEEALIQYREYLKNE